MTSDPLLQYSIRKEKEKEAQKSASYAAHQRRRRRLLPCRPKQNEKWEDARCGICQEHNFVEIDEME